MSHSNKTISSHYCSFVDEARRHKPLDTFQTTVTTVITNQTLKQNPICVSLITPAHSDYPHYCNTRVNPRPAAPLHGLTITLLPRPTQDIRSLQRNLALFNHPCIAPSICIAHTIAILSHDYCAIYDPRPTPLVHAVHHTTTGAIDVQLRELLYLTELPLGLYKIIFHFSFFVSPS